MARDEVVVDVGGRSVRVSHPAKVLFPAQGWTKMDLVEHYLVCGDGALLGVWGRPTVLKRWNEGVAGEPFFQKRAPKDSVHEYATIRFPSGRTADLLVPRHVADVAWMAQLNCLDLNPWPVRAEDVDHPDELRVDLDPTPEADFEAVRRVAAECGRVLAEHDLVGWPKTSGSRGLHVYVRIRPRWSFTAVRRAALALAREVERRLPGLATSAWWKEERHGVFVDYNQNARDRTVASAYSVRHTGLVSAPVSWEEVADVDPRDFPMGTFAASRYAAVGDPAAGIDQAVGDLDGLLDLARRDEAQGLGDAPWPPHFPKQDDEPPRVQPSRRRSQRPSRSDS
ncbi:MAG TPA: DNA primase small subunit domain-containing protein [Egibacteraceae bacterium]|nr:ATP-dependent DNA ligase [Actinomycetota bacterium]HWB71899.1 DNA primase small subunit domain-containing protein [Egibacteraceae bacterium]